MATIKTAIALYDGVTAPLRSMNKAINIVLNSFEAMQSASSRAIDTSAIRDAREELAKAATAFDAIEQNIRDAESQQKRFNNQIRNGTSAAGGLWDKLKRIAATVGLFSAGKQIIEFSDDFVSTEARLNNAMIQFSDGGSLEELEQKVMASAQRSRTGYMDAAASIARLGINAKDAFGSMDEVIAFQELINKQFVISGANTQEQQAAMVQLTQAMASGVLRGEELNSVFDQAPGIVQSIADYLDVPIGQIRNMAAEGQITSTIVKNAMFAASDEIEAKFERMPMTWSQIWTKITNDAIPIFTPLIKKINDLANSELVGKIADGIIYGLTVIASIANLIFDLMINVATIIVDNWSWLSPIILGVAAALAVYYGRLLLVKAAELASAAATGALTVAKMLAVPIYAALTGATMANTAAQWGLNTAMYACPLVWIIILIIALIAIVYAAVAAVNHFAGTSVSATGIICGAFMTALAFIGNILIAAWNLVVDVFVLIYNLVADVANFIGNVFTDPIGAVCRLFFDLADTVLGILQALASAIDTIFGSNLAGSVQGWRDSLGGWVDDTFGKGKEVMAKMNADDLKLGRFEYGAAWDMGYQFGQGIDDKVSGLFDFSGLDNLGAYDPPRVDDYNNGIYNNTGDIAGNTAAMNDSLGYSEEYLESMRDIAEGKAINRFTTAEIHIDMGGITNHLASNIDLDGVVNAFGERLAEEVLVSAEGVHA